MSIRKPFKSASSSSKTHPDSFRLFLAARHNQVGVLKEILERHDDAADWRQSGKTPLHAAVENGNFMAVQLLLKHYADPAAREGAFGPTPLHAAAKIDRADLAGTLLHHLAPVDTLRGGDNTPLMDAIYWDSRKVAATLLKFGASVTKQNKEGNAALHIAAERDYPEAAALLLDHGAKINAPDGKGWTPLMIAADNGRLETCAVLLSRGCDHHLKNSDGKTALDLALAIGDNDPEFVAGFKMIWEGRNRKDALTMGAPFIEGTDRAVNVRKPLTLRHPGRKPRFK